MLPGGDFDALRPARTRNPSCGGGAVYECINSSTYEYALTLKMYRDCANGQAPFDNPIELFIFDGNNGNRLQVINIPKPANTPQIQPANWDSCVATPYSICVEEGIYETTVILPPNPGGYDLAGPGVAGMSPLTTWVTPLGEGASFLAHIPDPCWPTVIRCRPLTRSRLLFLCVNQPLF